MTRAEKNSDNYGSLKEERCEAFWTSPGDVEG